MRAFLDTNFLLDCVLPGRPEHAAAQTIKGLVDVGLIEGVVSACSLKDAYYILTKQAGEARAREVVRDCLKSYSVEPLDQEACFTSAYSPFLHFSYANSAAPSAPQSCASSQI